MKKFLAWFFIILAVGGIGYFFSNDTKSVKGEPVVVAESSREKEVVEKEDLMEVRTGIQLDKVWKYPFEQPLDAQSISSQTVSVIDDSGEIVDIEVELVDEGRTLRISPPASGYEKGKKYELFISEKITYIDGTTAGDDHHVGFVTVRDEVEEGRLNPGIVTIKEEQMEVLDNGKMEITKTGLASPITKESIIIVPTEQYPEGQALKITAFEEGSASYVVEVEEPEFLEIYEELDIYKSYPLNSANLTPDEDTEGISITSITAFNVPSMVAAINTSKNGSKEEFEEEKETISTSFEDGIQIKFNDYILDKKLGLSLDGTVHLLSPQVKVDMKHSFLKVDHMSLESDMNLVTDLSITREANGEKPKAKSGSKKPKPIKMNVGSIYIPTAIPGLLIEGNVIMRLDLDVEGEPEVYMHIEYKESTGFYYDGSTINNVSTNNLDSELGVQGKGEMVGKAGPAVNVLATGYGVTGIGVEGYSGLRLKAAGVAGVGTDGPFTCARMDYGGFGQASFIVNTLKVTLLEFVLPEFTIGKENTINSCESVVNFVSMEPILMNSAEEKEVKVENQLQDQLTKTKSVETANMENVDIAVWDEEVLEVEKQDGGILIRTFESPQKEVTRITLTHKVGSKEIELVIPVRILDFKEAEDKQEETEPETVPETVQVESGSFAWEGEWERRDLNNGGLLAITGFDGESFYMEMNVAYGGRTGMLEGVAEVTEDKAVYKDADFDTGCRLELQLSGSSILIEQNDNCSSIGGLNTSFGGEYVNTDAGIPEPVYTLSSRNILDENHDLIIQQMLGDNYDHFVESMQIVYTDPGRYGLTDDTLVYDGGVPGLYTIMEGIILIEPNTGRYYVAYIADSGTKVRFHTNDAAYQSELPAAVHMWRERFSDYSIEYNYKN